MDDRGRGRFVVNDQGAVVRVPEDGPLLVPPILYRPGSTEAIGPTRLCEWLMVDVRSAKLVSPGSRLFVVCQELSEREPPACGVIEGTLVIDLVETSPEDRAVLLDARNWPRPS